MSAAWKYFNDESCSWRVACPSSSDFRFMLWSVSASLTSGDRFSIRNATTGTSLANFTTSVTGRFVESSDLLLDYISYRSTVSNGAAATFSCRRQRCSALSGGDVFTGSSGTIMTDQDGAGSSSRYLPGEECLWTIQCPGGESYILLTITTSTANADDFVSVNHGISTTFFARSQTVTQYFPGPELYVGFTSLTQNGGNGATIQYNCRRSLCSVDESHVSGVNGTLLSDPDGSGSFSRVTSSDRCRYTITCPADYAFLAMDASLSILSGDSITVVNENWSERIVVTSSSLRTFSNVIATGGRPVTVLFNVSASTRPNGFTMTWRCHEFARCPSVSPPIQVSSSVAANSFALQDVEASHTKSMLTTSSSARSDSCTWFGACPSEAPNLFIRAVWPYSTTNEQWQVRRNSSNEILVSSSTARLPAVESLVTDIDAFRITFSSSFQSTTPYTSSWTWMCSRSRCQAPTDGAIFTWNRTAGISSTITSA
ncbi:MAG: hypothetical protein Q8J97_11950, partial [Flavobacteriaceae bacterium]|nr:hypothetical protein [Flavobacteriaceae bacterium]